MPNNVDVLLDELEHEVGAYLGVRAAMRMLGIRLTAAIGEYLQQPADHELLNQAYALRRQYREREREMADTLDRWRRSEGAEDALWNALPAMAPDQVRRFDDLSALHRTTAKDRDELKRMQTRLRGLVLLFEEMAV